MPEYRFLQESGVVVCRYKDEPRDRYFYQPAAGWLRFWWDVVPPEYEDWIKKKFEEAQVADWVETR